MTAELHTGDVWRRRRAIAQRRREVFARRPPEWSEVRLDGDTLALDRVREALEAQALFDDALLIHIPRADHLPTDTAEGVAEAIRRGLPETRMLLLEADALDKRRTLYRTLREHGTVEHHAAPNRRELPQAVKGLLDEHGVRLSRDAFRHLLESVTGELARLDREIEKLAVYAADRPSSGELTVDELDGVLFRDQGGHLFGTLDAWLERRSDAGTRLRTLLARGEEPSKVFYMLAAQAQALLQVQSLANEGRADAAIARETGMFQWLAAKRRRQAEIRSEDELIALVHELHREDLRLKRGEREPEAALWAVFVADARRTGEAVRS